jgi:mRNA-degrading endonuclease RelE of RelBE toxin-antitoxin system
MRIRISDEFKTAYKRLKKKHKSLEADFEKLLLSLLENPRQGVEILEDIWKIRLNITSKGRGKSGGARVIIRIRIVWTNSNRFIFMTRLTLRMSTIVIA